MIEALRLWTLTWFALTFTSLWCVAIERNDLAFAIAILATLAFTFGVLHVSILGAYFAAECSLYKRVSVAGLLPPPDHDHRLDPVAND